MIEKKNWHPCDIFFFIFFLIFFFHFFFHFLFFPFHIYFFSFFSLFLFSLFSFIFFSLHYYLVLCYHRMHNSYYSMTSHTMCTCTVHYTECILELQTLSYLKTLISSFAITHTYDVCHADSVKRLAVIQTDTKE